MDVYNIEAAEVDINVYVGDAIDLSFSVNLNGSAYSLTGITLDMTITKLDGTTVIRALSSEGAGNEITKDSNTCNIVTTAFTEPATLKYTLKGTVGDSVSTISRGRFNVQE
jgi:hypothetical protein